MNVLRVPSTMAAKLCPLRVVQPVEAAAWIHRVAVTGVIGQPVVLDCEQ